MLDSSLTPFKILIVFFFSCLSAYFAHKQGRNPYLWFFVGFFLGALGVITLLFLKPQKKKPAPRRKPVSLSIKGPVDKPWYYVDSSQQQQGPLSWHALVAFLQKGTVHPQTYVWNEELSDWRRIAELMESKPS